MAFVFRYCCNKETVFPWFFFWHYFRNGGNSCGRAAALSLHNDRRLPSFYLVSDACPRSCSCSSDLICITAPFDRLIEEASGGWCRVFGPFFFFSFLFFFFFALLNPVAKTRLSTPVQMVYLVSPSLFDCSFFVRVFLVNRVFNGCRRILPVSSFFFCVGISCTRIHRLIFHWKMSPNLAQTEALLGKPIFSSIKKWPSKFGPIKVKVA